MLKDKKVLGMKTWPGESLKITELTIVLDGHSNDKWKYKVIERK